MLKDPQNSELKSIIALSSPPIKDLKTVITHLTKQIKINEKTPLIVKPFLKRDIPTITSLDENEWLTLLTKIKGSLESINSTALKIIAKNRAEKPTSDKPKNVTKLARKRASKDIQFTKKIIRKDTSTSHVPSHPEEKSKKTTVYCPECGHECQGRKGLKVHIFQVHNQSREKMLQAIKLYDVQATHTSDVS